MADAVIWAGQYGKLLPSLGLKLNDDKEYRTLSVNPSSGGGVAAAIGSVGARDNSGVGEFWFKTGSADTAWVMSGMAMGAAITSGTAGSVLFVGTGPVLAQNNPKFFWDNSSEFLGVGTNGPNYVLDLLGQTGPDVDGENSGILSINNIGLINTSLNFGIDTTYSWIQSRAYSDTGEHYILSLNPSGGYVGVKTIAPIAPFDVVYASTTVGPTNYGQSASANENSAPKNYVTGDVVSYIIYEIYTIRGETYYSEDFAATEEVTLLAAHASVDISWDPSSNSDVTGYLVVLNFNGSGFNVLTGAYHYAFGLVNSVTDGFNDPFTWDSTPMLLPTTADVKDRTMIGYFDGDVSTYGLLTYGDAYIGGFVGINEITPSCRLHVIETDISNSATAILQGYSDGGTGSRSILEIRNSLSSRMITFGTANLAGAGDYGNINFFGTATSSFNGYSFGDFNWMNNSGELFGDLRVGTMRVYRDGAANKSTFQLLIKNGGAFQYAIVSTFDNKTGLSGISAPTARLHLPAGSGTASTAPIKLTSGSLLTTPEAGAIEFLSDKYYATITTGAARKEFALVDAALTSGRVAFATTNGRLVDDSDFTFATDTLTVTKIAATTFTGNLTISTKDIVTDTTTGTKFGTGTTQKIGFYNATPIVQPGATTDLGTVLSNLGLRASGTAYPITTSGAVQFTGGVTITTANVTLTDKDIVLGTSTGTKFGTATNQKLSFFNSTPVIQQTDGAALTNNVASGGTTDTIANYTDLIIYANDAAAIRNDLYQLARKMKIVDDAMRLYGLLS